MPAITFQRERLTADLFGEAMRLFSAHHEECRIADLMGRPFEPDVEQYVRLEDAGVLWFFTARHEVSTHAASGPGDLIGYSAMLVMTHLQFRGVLTAMQDALFIHREHRGTTGYRLMRYVDDYLAEGGIKAIVRQTMDRSNVGKLYERLGYQLTEHVYMRRLDAPQQRSES